MNKYYFRIIYYDYQNKRFGVSDEVVSSDNDITNKTCAFKRNGLEVRILLTAPVIDISKVPSVEEVVKSLEDGYKYDPFLHW